MIRKLSLMVIASILITVLLFAGCSQTPTTVTITSPPNTVTVTAPAPAPVTVTVPATTPTPVTTPPLTPPPTPKPASVSVSPTEATNPVKTQHTLVATVKEADGSPSVGAEVDWILNRFSGAVGDIVEASNQTKFDNLYAISKTGTDGTAKMTITSTREGDTDITVMVPGITDPAKHKVFAVKHWVDMMVDWPVNATNSIGTDHTLSVKVYKATNKSPLGGVNVKWTITDNDPALKINGLAVNTLTTSTDATGIASVTVQQVTAAAGDNTIHMDVLSAGGTVLYSQDVTKKWLAPTLNVLKEGPSSVQLGASVSYTITVRNDGAATATGVQVTDQIPDGLSFVSSTPSGTASGGTVTWTLGDIASGTSSKIVATFTANKVGNWTNTATATSKEGITAKASAPLVVTAQAVFQITKTGPATVTQGQKADYTITVQNTGNMVADGTVVTDTIPSGLTYVSSSPIASIAGNVATWSIGSLSPGAIKTITITFNAAIVGSAVNNVQVTATGATTAMASCTTVIVAAPVPNVSVTKSGPSSIYVNNPAQFTIIVNNPGQTSLTNVKVTDTLPANLSYISSSPTGTVGGNTVTWMFGSLAMGASQTITIQCGAIAIGSFQNLVNVTTAEGAIATAQASGTVTAASGVTVQITDTIDPVAVGGQTTYQATVINQGLIAIHNLSIQFQLPTQVSFVSAAGSTTYTVSGQNVTFALGASLNAGQTITFTVTVKANSAGNVFCTVISSYAESTTPLIDQQGTTIYTP